MAFKLSHLTKMMVHVSLRSRRATEEQQLRDTQLSARL